MFLLESEDNPRLPRWDGHYFCLLLKKLKNRSPEEADTGLCLFATPPLSF